MAQLVKAYRRINLRQLARGLHGALLVACFPFAAKYRLVAIATGNKLLKEVLALIRQDNMKAFALFAGPTLRTNVESAAVGIEIMHPKAGEVAISRSCFERRSRQQTELRISSVEKTLALREREIGCPRLVHVLERLYAPPFRIGGDLAFGKGVIERGLQ